MNNESAIFINPKIRMLVFQKYLTEDIRLTACGVERCLPEYTFNSADRPGYHLHVILEGKGKLRVNGKETNLTSGQMFICKPGEETWYKADIKEPWIYCWMSFEGKLAKKCAEDAGFLGDVNHLDCNIDTKRFYTIVAKALNQVDVAPSHIYSRTGLLLEFIGAAIESRHCFDDQAKKSSEVAGVDYVKYAIDYIRSNYATAKISDVARHIGLNRSYLSQIFKIKTGISPQEFLMKCKIQNACKLLVETNNPIQEISRQVGYDNPLTFSKTFKNVHGMSPKTYRENNKKESEKVNQDP